MGLKTQYPCPRLNIREISELHPDGGKRAGSHIAAKRRWTVTLFTLSAGNLPWTL